MNKSLRRFLQNNYKSSWICLARNTIRVVFADLVYNKDLINSSGLDILTMEREDYNDVC